MRQRTCWRLLVRVVDAAAASAGGRKQELLGSGHPCKIQDGLAWGMSLGPDRNSSFIAVRSYAAPIVKGGKASKQKPRPSDKIEPEKDPRRVNRAVVARNIRLIGEDGKSHEVLTRAEALQRAVRSGLDLVEVDGKVDPVVCKLMDYKKEKFKEKQREKELRKKQVEKRRLDDMKEIRYGFKTEQKDLEMKADMATRSLLRGHRVKVTILTQGQAADGVPLQQLQKMIDLLKDVSKIEVGPRLDPTRTWVLLRPLSVTSRKSGQKSGGKDESSDSGDDSDNDEPHQVDGLEDDGAAIRSM